MLTATDEKNLFEVDATAVKIEKGSIDDFENISLDADQKASTPYYVTVKIRTRVRTCGNDAAQMSAITGLFAGVPVTDLDVSIDWYTRFFGRAPDVRVGDEILWEIEEHATLFIEPNAAQAGAGRITLAVAGLDALLERLDAEGIEHEPIETYSNGVRHVTVPDPDGNAIAFAEPPSASS